MFFRTSSALAAAYGIAVTGDMVITTCLLFIVAWKFWRWSPVVTALVIAPFFVIELIFLGANALKIPQGGWFPLLIGTGLFILMWTWRKGSRLLAEISHRGRPPLPEFIRMAESSSVPRVPGTAMFLTGNAQDVPAALLHNMKHNKVLHDQNVILTIVTEEVPRLVDEDRVTVEKLSDRFSRVIVRFGFMESPDVPKALRGGELRPGGRVVLPVAAGAASVGPFRIAAVAGLHLHSAGALRERRVRSLLHPGGSRGRSRRTDHDLTGATAWAQEARRGGWFLCDVCLSGHPGPITGRLAWKRATRRNRGSRTRPSQARSCAST